MCNNDQRMFALIAVTFLIASAEAFLLDSFKYLRQYGYLDEPFFRAGVDEAQVRKALLRFQDFHGLKKTGVLDEATKELMKRPRCGLPDIERENAFLIRFKRSNRDKWSKKMLSFYVGSYPERGESTKELNSKLTEAFSIWSASSGLIFKKASSYSNADIKIDFLQGKHGDGFPFDGPNGVLAHAFYPISGGSIHFDNSEDWRLQKPRYFKRSYKQLLQIAVHEIGHSLGLNHSRNQRSIMAPTYKGWLSDIQLAEEDILNIQRKYGPPRNSKKDDERNFDEDRIHFHD